MMISSGGRATRVPAMTVLAGAVAGVLLLGSSPSIAQTAYPDPGKVGDQASWKTEEFSKDWGLAAIGAEYAYARGLSGAGINVGVMDSGVASWHSDLQGKVSGMLLHDEDCDSPNTFAGPDACYYADGSPSVVYTEPLPEAKVAELRKRVAEGTLSQATLDYILGLQGYHYETHGTHVAGTIAASRNGAGSHGVAFASNLHAAAMSTNIYRDMLSALGQPGGTYVAQQLSGDALQSMFAKMESQGVRVLNNSWGWGSEPKTEKEMDEAAASNADTIEAYTAWAKKTDAIQVWAAGNDYGNIAGFLATIPRYDKAAEPYWLSVANLAPTGKLDASSSICGLSKAWCITAPGTNISSTVPTGEIEGEMLTYKDGSNSGFEVTKAGLVSGQDDKTGTSMAAPHVTGAMALLFERYPYLTSAQVRDVLLTTAKDLGEVGVDEIYGWGLMDLKKAIDGPGQMRVDTEVKMDRRAGGTKVWEGAAWDDWRNDISGTGKLTKSGEGWLRLSGNNSFAGAVLKDGVLELNGTNTLTSDMQVFGGELLLNGSLQDTGLDVQAGVATVQGQVSQGVTHVAAGGRLQGTGTLAQTTMAGTLAPGVAGIGTLHVDGNYTQLAGSTYELDVGTQGESDRLEVSGQADLQGGQIIATGATLGERYRVLTAQSIAGSFASANAINQPFLSLKVDQTANRVDLDVERGKALATAAFTGNQLATAQAADHMSDDNALLKRLTQLSADQATAAFDRINGETYASQRGVLLEQGYELNEAAASRLRSTQDGFTHQSDDKTSNGIWIDTKSSGGEFNGDGNAARVDHKNHGMKAGYDRAFANGWIAGVMGSSITGETKVAERGAKAESESRALGLYAGKQWNGVALRAGWAMSEHRVTSDRQAAYGPHLDRNQARYTSKGQQGFIEAGYAWKLGEQTLVEPYAQWSRVAISDPRLQETGGMSALKVDAERSQVDFGTAGLRLAKRLGQSGGQDWLQLKGSLAYRMASGDWQSTATAGWLDSDAFTSWGAPISKRATLLSLEAVARLSPAAMLELGYGGQFGSEGQDHAVNARLSLKF